MKFGIRTKELNILFHLNMSQNSSSPDQIHHLVSVGAVSLASTFAQHSLALIPLSSSPYPDLGDSQHPLRVTPRTRLVRKRPMTAAQALTPTTIATASGGGATNKPSPRWPQNSPHCGNSLKPLVLVNVMVESETGSPGPSTR